MADVPVREWSARFGVLLDFAAQHLPGFLWRTNRDLVVVEVHTGRSRARPPRGSFEPGRRVSAYFDSAEHAHRALRAHHRALNGREVSFDVEMFGRRFAAVVLPLFSNDGSVIGVTGFALDISAKERLFAAIGRSEEAFAAAQASAHLGSWEWDLRTGRFRWSHELYRLCGLEPGPHAVKPHALSAAVHPDDRLALDVAIELAREERKPYALDTRIVRADGTVRWVQHRGRFDYDEFGAVRAIGTVLDIHGRKMAEEDLAYRAHYDELTKLPNRRFFLNHLGEAIADARTSGARLGVLYIDLDRFKTINDTLGYDVGDQFLKAVVPRLAPAVGEESFVARCGGDEFAALVSNVTAHAELARIAERIVAAFAAPVAVGGRELYSSASVGIAVFPDDGSSAEELLRRADAACGGGPGKYQFHAPQAQLRAIDRLELEHALRRGLDGDEFVIYYQPIVDRFERPVGVEALVRWQTSDRGLVPPDRFIPLAEEIGLIVPLGRSIISKALTQLAEWTVAGLPSLRLALNISARQLLDPELLGLLASEIERTGIHPSRIELEITESIVIGDIPGVRQLIADIKALGVRFSLDDFGTGYSALSYLKHFAVDALKIDRSFVKDLPGDRGDTAIVNAVIALGHALGLTVVAEGVETAAQAGLVRRLGCDELQGYFFAKPMTADACEDVIRRWSGLRKSG